MGSGMIRARRAQPGTLRLNEARVFVLFGGPFARLASTGEALLLHRREH